MRLKGGDPSLEAVTDPDPMGQWAWLSKVMETAEKKRQNVMEFQPFFSLFFFSLPLLAKTEARRQEGVYWMR